MPVPIVYIYSHPIAAHTIILNGEGIIQAVNTSSVHLDTPPTVIQYFATFHTYIL